MLSKEANDTAADFIRRKIGAVINDPVVRDKLVPKGHPFAARRPSVDSGYFQAFNRDNVELADLRESPIVEFTPEGIRTTVKSHSFDTIIFATGFDAFTGSLLKPDIVGRGAMTLREKWAAGPITQLGVGVSDFPNMLIVVGPGSPSLLSNVMVSTEEQIDWLADLISHMESRKLVEFEAEPQAEQRWVAHVNERAKETLSERRFLLQRRRNPRQAAGVHALFGRRAGLPSHLAPVRTGRLQRLHLAGCTGCQRRRGPSARGQPCMKVDFTGHVAIVTGAGGESAVPSRWP